MSEPTEREWLEGLHPDAQSAVVIGATDVLRAHRPTRFADDAAEFDAALADLDALVQAAEAVSQHGSTDYSDVLDNLDAALARVKGEAA